MGYLISFEGVDGAGKTTQIENLMPWLSEHSIKAQAIREPGGTKVSDQIRELLLHTPRQHFTARTEALLFYAARLNVIEKVILPQLEKGQWIIADRYIDSTRVYQRAVASLIATLEHTLQVPMPSLTFLLDIQDTAKIEERLQTRGKQNHFDLHVKEHLLEMAAAYRESATRAPERFVILDATADKMDIQAKIRQTIQERLRIP